MAAAPELRARRGLVASLVRDGVIYGAAAILTAGTTFLLLPLYTNLLTPGDIGQIELLTIVASLVYVTVALEVAQGLARYLPETMVPSDRRAYAAAAFRFSVLAYAAMAAVGLALAPVIAEALLGPTASAELVRVAVVATFAGG